jgi:hypothetical protein
LHLLSIAARRTQHYARGVPQVAECLRPMPAFQIYPIADQGVRDALDAEDAPVKRRVAIPFIRFEVSAGAAVNLHLGSRNACRHPHQATNTNIIAVKSSCSLRSQMNLYPRNTARSE